MRVLIVDDIFSNRLLLSESLRTLGIDCDQVINGKQAIEAMKIRDYDLVLMDIEMPVMNGIEATIHIREKMFPPKNRITIVALTAHDQQLFLDDLKDVGFDSMLTKPYSFGKLSQLIGELNK